MAETQIPPSYARAPYRGGESSCFFDDIHNIYIIGVRQTVRVVSILFHCRTELVVGAAVRRRAQLRWHIVFANNHFWLI